MLRSLLRPVATTSATQPPAKNSSSSDHESFSKIPRVPPPKRCLVCLAPRTYRISKSICRRLELTLQVGRNTLSSIHLCLGCRGKVTQLDRLIKYFRQTYKKNKGIYSKIEVQLEEHSYSKWRSDDDGENQHVGENPKDPTVEVVGKESLYELLATPAKSTMTGRLSQIKQGPKIVPALKEDIQDGSKRDSKVILVLPCPICDATYSIPTFLNIHLEVCHWKKKEDGTLVCVQCNQEFYSTETLVPHARSHRSGMLPCTKCPLVFPNWGKVKEHRAVMHTEEYESLNPKPVYECDICREVAETQSLLSYHKLLVHGTTARILSTRPRYRNSCPYCQLSFARVWRLQKHLRVHGMHVSVPQTRAPEARRMNKNTSLTILPSGQKPGNLSPGKDTVVVVYKGSQEKREPRLRGMRHRSGYYAIQGSKGEKPKLLIQRAPKIVKFARKVEPIVCGCGESFNAQAAFRQHRIKVHGGRFVCDVQGCQTSCTSNYALIRHRSRHFPETINCEICGKKFRHPHQLDAHKRQVHNAVKSLSAQLNALIPGSNITDAQSISNQQIKTEPFPIIMEQVRQEDNVIVTQVRHEGEEKESSDVTSKDDPEQNSAQQDSTQESKRPEPEEEEAPCPVCDATYRRDHYLSRHIEACHWKIAGDKVFCITCEEPFPSLAAILHHARKHRRDFQTCSECSQVFPNWTQMFDHKKSAHAPKKETGNKAENVAENEKVTSYTCDICQESSETKSLLSFHRLLVHGTTTKLMVARTPHKYCCKHCDLSFPQKLKLDKHKIVHSKRSKLPEAFRNICDKCYDVFPDEKSKNEHFLHCRGPSQNLTDEKLREYPCCVCDAVFEFPGGIEQHLASAHWTTDTEGLKCVFCAEVFQDVVSVATHARTHRGDMVPCKRCPDTVFSLVSQFSIHSSNVHNNNMKYEKRTYCCPACSEETDSKSLLALHHLVSHGGLIQLKPDTRIHICPICKRTFGAFPYLRRHMRKHATVRETAPKFQCLDCKKSFNVKVLLEKHIADRVCSLKKSLTSSDCEAGREKVDQVWLCTYCGKTYKSKKYYNFHMRIHSGDQLHQCPTCQRKFATPSSLKYHQKSHEKPHVCSVCGARFGYDKHLQEHMVIHSDRKDWVCEVCGQSFRWRLSLLSHLWAAHQIGKDPRVPAAIIICNLCSKQMSKKNLRRHFKDFHPNATCTREDWAVIGMPSGSPRVRGRKRQRLSSKSEVTKKQKSVPDTNQLAPGGHYIPVSGSALLETTSSFKLLVSDQGLNGQPEEIHLEEVTVTAGHPPLPCEVVEEAQIASHFLQQDTVSDTGQSGQDHTNASLKTGDDNGMVDWMVQMQMPQT